MYRAPEFSGSLVSRIVARMLQIWHDELRNSATVSEAVAGDVEGACINSCV